MAFKTTFADPISIVKGSRVKMDESNRSFSDQRPSPGLSLKQRLVKSRGCPIPSRPSS